MQVHNQSACEWSKKMRTYKIDGAKFESMEELRGAMWTLYREKMSPVAFEAYLIANVEEISARKIAS